MDIKVTHKTLHNPPGPKENPQLHKYILAHHKDTLHIGTFENMNLLKPAVSITNKTRHDRHDTGQTRTRGIRKLVYQLHASNRALVTRTGQQVVIQVEMCECSQLPEVGWDATCEASRQMSHCE